MISVKRFRKDESERTGLSESAIAMRMSRGRYTRVPRKVVHAREIYLLEIPRYKRDRRFTKPKNKNSK